MAKVFLSNVEKNYKPAGKGIPGIMKYTKVKKSAK